jgi:hypothetical protein
MIKKQIALALGAALSFGGASVAHAGFYQYANGFSANYAFSEFSDSDSSFKLTFSNVSGNLEFNIPTAGTYGVTRKGEFDVDYNGTSTASPFGPLAGAACGAVGKAGWDFCSKTTAFTSLGSGDLTYSGISGSKFIYNWNTDVFTSNGNAYTMGDFSGSGAGVMLFLGMFLGPVGSLISTNIGDGTVFVHQVFDGAANKWELTLTESAGVGIINLLKALDAGTTGIPGLPAPLQNAMIDGVVYANGVVHIPEPTSMALLGLGMAGLAAVRRRKAA